MASSSAAQLLDELLGRDRNLAPTEKRREVRWEDPETCKYFLCGFCPHELFVNTRADLGPCDKLHDEELKKSYQKSSRVERMGYEEDFMRFLESLLTDVERRIKRGHARLALNSAQAGNLNNAASNREEQIEMLTKKINDLVEEAEVLGCEGKVEEAQGVMRLCEQFKEERTSFELPADRRERHQLEGDGIKKMDVCDVCGALLVAGDAQQRIDEHLMGKQHMGYARIRSYVEGRKNKAFGDEVDREERIAKEKEEREKEREREREERRTRLETREKERVKEREELDRKQRSQSRSRRSRSRSSRHSRRSRSKDRKKRSRSRERSRDHKRHRSRSSSKNHSRRSSRERRRSSSRSRRSSRDRKDRSRSRGRSSRDKDRKSRDKESSRTKEKDDERDGDRQSKEKDDHKSRDGDHKSPEKEQSDVKDKEESGSTDKNDTHSGEHKDIKSQDEDMKEDRDKSDHISKKKKVPTATLR